MNKSFITIEEFQNKIKTKRQAERFAKREGITVAKATVILKQSIKEVANYLQRRRMAI